MLSHAARRRLARLSPLALLALAGVANAQPLNWTGSCGPNWFDICVVGACGPSNLMGNNFGQTNCVFNPPFPNGANQVFLANNNVTLNGSASVGSLSLLAGGTLNWVNGDLNMGAGFTSAGVINVTGGDRSFFGPLNSSNTLTYNANLALFQSCTLTNTGTMNLLTGDLRNWTGSNSIINNGTWIKAGSADATCGVSTAHNGQLQVQAGRLFLQNASLAFANSSVTNVSGGAELRLRTVTLTGQIQGTIDGFFGIDATSSLGAGGLTLNVANNGFQWTAGDLQYSGQALINSPTGRFIITGADRSTLNAVTDNRGYLSFNAGVWYFQTHALLNAGTLEVLTGDWRNWTGTNSLINTATGTIAKTSALDWSCTVPFTLSGALNVQAGRMLLSSGGINFQPGSLITTSVNGQGRIRSNAMTGTMTCQNSGFFGQDGACSLSGNLSMNVTINGWQWESSDLQLAGNTLTAMPTNRMFITGGDRSMLGGTFINNGYLSADAGILYFQTLAMTNSGTLEVASGDWRNWTGANSFTLSPGGVMRKVASGSNWIFQPPATIAGTVQAQGDTLFWQNSSADFLASSSINVSSGANLRFRSMNLRGRIAGVSNGFLGSDGAITLGDDLTIAVTGNGFEHAGSDYQYAGHTLTVAPGSLYKITGGDRSALNGATVNNGTLDYSAGIWYFQGHALTNNSILNQHSGDWRNWTGTNSFVNNGTYTKDTASAAALGVSTTNTGTYRVIGGSLGIGSFTQNAGLTIVDGGSMSGSTPMVFNGGSLIARGNMPAITNVGGSVNITGSGGSPISSIALSGRYIQQAGGVLSVDISGDATFDQITSSGSPSVDGTLVVNVLGGYDPTSKVFTIITGTQPATGSFPVDQVVVHGFAGIARAGASGNNVVLYFPCSFADIADDQGNIPPKSGIPNTGVNEGDYNGFFAGFFEAKFTSDIADDQGNPVPPGVDQVPNSGVNEGDYNLFFQLFFQGC